MPFGYNPSGMMHEKSLSTSTEHSDPASLAATIRNSNLMNEFKNFYGAVCSDSERSLADQLMFNSSHVQNTLYLSSLNNPNNSLDPAAGSFPFMSERFQKLNQQRISLPDQSSPLGANSDFKPKLEKSIKQETCKITKKESQDEPQKLTPTSHLNYVLTNLAAIANAREVFQASSPATQNIRSSPPSKTSF